MAKFQKGNPGGPGRPAKADKHARPIARAEKRIADRLVDLVDKQLELAFGVWREETLPDGETRIVYQQPPDRHAIEYLLNRIMGKPTERRELSGPERGPIPVETFDYGAAIAAITDGSDEDSEASSEDPSLGDGEAMG
jgi:hypothetical protein